MGFCRTNLFKRLESGGPAFLQSVERHILRNYVFLHAIEHDLPLPIGTQDAELLDTRDSRRGCGRWTRRASSTTRRTMTRIEDGPRARRRRLGAAATRSEYRAARRRSLRRLRHAVSHAASSGCGRPCSSTRSRPTCAPTPTALLEVLAAVRRLGPGTRRQAGGAARPADRRRTRATRCWSSPSSPTRCATSRRSFGRAASAPRGRDRRAPPTPPALAWRFSPVSNDKRQPSRPATSCASWSPPTC